MTGKQANKKTAVLAPECARTHTHTRRRLETCGSSEHGFSHNQQLVSYEKINIGWRVSYHVRLQVSQQAAESSRHIDNAVNKTSPHAKPTPSRSRSRSRPDRQPDRHTDTHTDGRTQDRQTDRHTHTTQRNADRQTTEAENHLAVPGGAARRGQRRRERHLDGPRLVGLLPQERVPGQRREDVPAHALVRVHLCTHARGVGVGVV